MGTSYTPPSGLKEVASTGVDGYALPSSGQPVVLEWTAPNDGKLHAVVIVGSEIITTAITGGVIEASWTCGGQNIIRYLNGGTIAAGGYSLAIDNPPNNNLAIDPGSTVEVKITQPISAGAGTVYIKILAD